MRHSEKGFTIIEMIVAISIMSIIALAATMTTFQIINGAERSNSHMAAVCQVRNAGYWLSYDAQMAEDIVTDNLSSTEFMQLTWTELDYGNDYTDHTVTYFFEGLSAGIGTLKRNHWSSAGLDRDILVAEHIYYDSGDPSNTSQASYQSPVLTLQLTALYGNTMETREYSINCRPNL